MDKHCMSGGHDLLLPGGAYNKGNEIECSHQTDLKSFLFYEDLKIWTKKNYEQSETFSHCVKAVSSLKES